MRVNSKEKLENLKKKYIKQRNKPESGMNQMYRLLAGRLTIHEGLEIEQIAEQIDIWVAKTKTFKHPNIGTISYWRSLFNLFDERDKIKCGRGTTKTPTKFFCVRESDDWNEELDKADYGLLRSEKKLNSYEMAKEMNQEQIHKIEKFNLIKHK